MCMCLYCMSMRLVLSVCLQHMPLSHLAVLSGPLFYYTQNIFMCKHYCHFVFPVPRRAASWILTADCFSLTLNIDSKVAIINLLIKGWENRNLSNLSTFSQVHISCLAKIFYYGWHHYLDGRILSSMDLFLASYHFYYYPSSPEAVEVPFVSSHSSIFGKRSSPQPSFAVLDLIVLLWGTCSCVFWKLVTMKQRS